MKFVKNGVCVGGLGWSHHCFSYVADVLADIPHSYMGEGRAAVPAFTSHPLFGPQAVYMISALEQTTVTTTPTLRPLSGGRLFCRS